MKILCETQTVNRLIQSNKSVKAVKATLAIGYHNSSKDINGERKKTLEIIHFTAQNKTGKRYKVPNNIEKIFTKFVQDGKATIGFIQPPENLMIKCDPIQLKGFLQTLKLGIDGKESFNLKLNIGSVSAIPQKSQPQIKMTVSKRADYPSKGFPKSLKSLTVQGIQIYRVRSDICSLYNLTVLNISYNQISELPKELGKLSLAELYVNHNNLNDGHSWQWLQNKIIQRSLKEMDLSANKLTYFPSSLIKCEQLITLKMNNNKISYIPFGIRRLCQLRFLHMSSNKLESLPSAFNYTRMELLDVWGNNFQPQIDHQLDVEQFGANHTYEPIDLWLQAIRAVCHYKLPYSAKTLPWILIDIITEAPKCACGKICIANNVLKRAAMSTFENIKSLVFSRDRLIYADIVLCGQSCAGRKQVFRS